jgi:prophage regulatory protein
MMFSMHSIIHIEKMEKIMEQLHDIVEVEQAVKFKRSTIYSLIKQGKFPAGIKLGRRTRRWPTSHIQAWISQKIGGAQ